MNPNVAGMLQTRERLYQVWYHHEHAQILYKKLAIDDARVQFAAVDADNHMTYLNLNMDLGLALSHFLLPGHDQRVVVEAARLGGELEAKAKSMETKGCQGACYKKRKSSGSGGPEEEDADVDGTVGKDGTKRVVKRHNHHKQVWDSLFTDHVELKDVQWTLEAASTCGSCGTHGCHTRELAVCWLTQGRE